MRSAAALGAMLLLAACSGTGANSNAPLLPTELTSRSTRPVKATLRIHVPRHRRRIRAHYVSPATQSVAVTITHAGHVTHANFDLTPATNPNCTAGPVVCTLTLVLEPGSNTLSIATYDGLLSGGNPTGNELSANQNVPITIAIGKANLVSVTLDAIPASVVLLPVNSTLAGTLQTGFSISKCFSSAKATVLSIDADGNFIIGPGAPAPSLMSSDTSHIAVATPAPSAPNIFVLTRPNLPTPFSTVTLTPGVTPAAGSGGSPVSQPVSVKFNGDICGIVDQFSNGFTSSGYGISVGPDGNLWTAENGNNAIAKVTTDGSVTEYAGFGTPTSIAAGIDGNLWYTQCGFYEIQEITTSGLGLSGYHTPTLGSKPYRIVSGPDGALWFTEKAGDRIGRMTTGGTMTEYSTPTSSSTPTGIANGPDGALWFTEESTNTIGRIDVAGNITEYTVPLASTPWDIATGADGNLWFTDLAGNAVGRMTTNGSYKMFPVPMPSSQPFGITAGPDGALWFGQAAVSYVGRIATDGTITEFSVPWHTEYLTTGPDNALWVTGEITAVFRIR